MLFELELFPFPAVLSTSLLLVHLVRSWRKRHSWPHLLILSLSWVYFLAVLTIVFLPIRIPQEWPRNITPETIQNTFSQVNLVPFHFGNLFTANPAVIFEQLVGNILLTLPLGFLLPFLVRLPARRIGWLALYAGLALEGLQLLIKLLGLLSAYGHAVDLNDAILNLLGVLAGYGLFCGFARFYRKWTCRVQIADHEMIRYLDALTMHKRSADQKIEHSAGSSPAHVMKLPGAKTSRENRPPFTDQAAGSSPGRSEEGDHPEMQQSRGPSQPIHISFILSAVFYLAYPTLVAAIGFLWGLGWMVLLWNLRSILLGTRPVRRLIARTWAPLFHLDPAALEDSPWPTRSWIVLSAIRLGISLAVLAWFNLPLAKLLGVV